MFAAYFYARLQAKNNSYISILRTKFAIVKDLM